MRWLLHHWPCTRQSLRISSSLKMEAKHFSESVMSTYTNERTRRHCLRDSSLRSGNVDLESSCFFVSFTWCLSCFFRSNQLWQKGSKSVSCGIRQFNCAVLEYMLEGGRDWRDACWRVAMPDWALFIQFEAIQPVDFYPGGGKSPFSWCSFYQLSPHVGFIFTAPLGLNIAEELWPLPTQPPHHSLSLSLTLTHTHTHHRYVFSQRDIKEIFHVRFSFTYTQT